MHDCRDVGSARREVVGIRLDCPVSFRRYAQFQIGYKGLVQLANRSGQYAAMSSPRAINKEAFSGYDSIGVPKIDWNLIEESKPTTGYAFGWRLVNGGESIFYWSLERVKAHAQRYSQSFRKKEGPWATHFPEMACKTVIKNSLSQFGVLSIQMQRAIKSDSGVILDIDAEPIYPDNPKDAAAAEEKPNLSDTEPSDNDGNVK
jgi:recombination protein RecT